MFIMLKSCVLNHISLNFLYTVFWVHTSEAHGQKAAVKGIDLVGVVSKLWGRSRSGGKQSFPPYWTSMVLTQNGLHKSISAAWQSKKRRKTELYWVGLSVRYLWLDKWHNRIARCRFPTFFCYLIESPGKRTAYYKPIHDACERKHLSFCLLNFNKVIKTGVKVCHTFDILKDF